MALVTNFLDRIKDLSGDCSDDNAIETFIIDGCYDVVNRVKAINPAKINLFTSRYELTSASVSVTGERDVFNVYRKTASDGDFYPCRLVSSSEGLYQYVNTSSIYFANNVFDPVYFFDNGNLYVLPEPTSAQLAKYEKLPDYSVTNVDSSTSDIANFPNQYYEHVLTYAGIHNLVRQINNLSGSISAGYTAPTIDGASISLTAMDDIVAEDNTVIGTDANFDTYTKWFQVVAEYIEDEEDSELAQMQLGKIQTYLSAYQAEQSNQQQIFSSSLEKHQFLISILQNQQQLLSQKYENLFVSEGLQQSPGGE